VLNAEQRALRGRSEARGPRPFKTLVLAHWQRLHERDVDVHREPLGGMQAFGALAGVFPLVEGNINLVAPRQERVDVIEGKLG
jgi:hypothetical protein